MNINPIIIGIAGGTGSGKSTLADNIKKEFAHNITMISHDCYYKAHPELPFEERAKLNYDHPDSIETSLLIEHLKELKKGNPIERPEYSFINHQREEETVKVVPKKVIIVDGILIFENKELRDLMDIKIFVDTDADIRFIRRLLRDVQERGSTLDSVVTQYCTTVKPMHYLYVEPTRSKADIVINSGKNDIAFDLFVSKIKLLLEKKES